MSSTATNHVFRAIDRQIDMWLTKNQQRMAAAGSGAKILSDAELAAAMSPGPRYHNFTYSQKHDTTHPLYPQQQQPQPQRRWAAAVTSDEDERGVGVETENNCDYQETTGDQHDASPSPVATFRVGKQQQQQQQRFKSSRLNAVPGANNNNSGNVMVDRLMREQENEISALQGTVQALQLKVSELARDLGASRSGEQRHEAEMKQMRELIDAVILENVKLRRSGSRGSPPLPLDEDTTTKQRARPDQTDEANEVKNKGFGRASRPSASEAELMMTTATATNVESNPSSTIAFPARIRLSQELQQHQKQQSASTPNNSTPNTPRASNNNNQNSFGAGVGAPLDKNAAAAAQLEHQQLMAKASAAKQSATLIQSVSMSPRPHDTSASATPNHPNHQHQQQQQQQQQEQLDAEHQIDREAVLSAYRRQYLQEQMRLDQQFSRPVGIEHSPLVPAPFSNAAGKMMQMNQSSSGAGTLHEDSRDDAHRAKSNNISTNNGKTRRASAAVSAVDVNLSSTVDDDPLTNSSAPDCVDPLDNAAEGNHDAAARLQTQQQHVDVPVSDNDEGDDDDEGEEGKQVIVDELQQRQDSKQRYHRCGKDEKHAATGSVSPASDGGRSRSVASVSARSDSARHDLSVSPRSDRDSKSPPRSAPLIVAAPALATKVTNMVGAGVAAVAAPTPSTASRAAATPVSDDDDDVEQISSTSSAGWQQQQQQQHHRDLMQYQQSVASTSNKKSIMAPVPTPKNDDRLHNPPQAKQQAPDVNNNHHHRSSSSSSSSSEQDDFKKNLTAAKNRGYSEQAHAMQQKFSFSALSAAGGAPTTTISSSSGPFASIVPRIGGGLGVQLVAGPSSSSSSMTNTVQQSQRANAYASSTPQSAQQQDDEKDKEEPNEGDDDDDDDGPPMRTRYNGAGYSGGARMGIVGRTLLNNAVRTQELNESRMSQQRLEQEQRQQLQSTEEDDDDDDW